MKFILIVIGTVSVGLGAVGVVLPGLPTTPFLLLAAACYGRSSTRFHHWLLNNPLFGRYISDYTLRKGLPLRTKIIALISLWATIGTTALFAVNSVHAQVALGIVALGVTTHLLWLKTL